MFLRFIQLQCRTPNPPTILKLYVDLLEVRKCKASCVLKLMLCTCMGLQNPFEDNIFDVEGKQYVNGYSAKAPMTITNATSNSTTFLFLEKSGSSAGLNALIPQSSFVNIVMIYPFGGSGGVHGEVLVGDQKVLVGEGGQPCPFIGRGAEGTVEEFDSGAICNMTISRIACDKTLRSCNVFVIIRAVLQPFAPYNVSYIRVSMFLFSCNGPFMFVFNCRFRFPSQLFILRLQFKIFPLSQIQPQLQPLCYHQ